jgi:glycosyltransferase involved in cell wall biosynthesis
VGQKLCSFVEDPAFKIQNCMKVAFLTTDNREQQAKYYLDQPFFGTAPSAVLDGLALLPEDVEVHVISCSKQLMNVPPKLASNIHFHQPIVPHIGWGRTAFAGCALAVRRALKEIQPDIVHGQGTERDCSISAVYSGFPNVLTIHGNMQRIYQMKLLGANSYYWLASTLETHALKRTSGVFCNSHHTRRLVEERTKKNWLVPNPIRPAFIATKAPENRSNSVPIFLVVGVITRLKRPLEILETMKALFEAGHRFMIHFAGNPLATDTYGEGFQQLLDEARQQGYAEHLGMLDEEQLIRAMDKADALIHFPEEEAFGLVVAEALARNLKIFTARIGGIPDILEDTGGSELFEDFTALKAGIEHWIKTGVPATMDNQTLMRERYSSTVIAQKHLEVYSEVIAAKAHK